MIYTIGHSTLSEPDFEKLIAPLDVLMDVRSHPGSKWPQFRKEHLEDWIPKLGKRYLWEPRLGGWDRRHLPLSDEFAPRGVDIPVYARGKFPKQRIALGSKEPTPAECLQGSLPGIRPSWTNQGLHDYSWFMSLDEFVSGAADLIELGRTANVGIMCCEVLWWKCHRSMVADYLVRLGEDPVHLQPKLKRHAESIGNRLDRYDPLIVRTWPEAP